MLEVAEIAPDRRPRGVSLLTKTFVWVNPSGTLTLLTRSRSRRGRLDKGGRYIE